MADLLVQSGSCDEKPELVSIAFIQTTHGRNGEVAADLLTDMPDRFRPGLRVLVRVGGALQGLSVASAWFHKGRVILKFEGVDSIGAAEAMRGSPVQVPRSERAPLPPGRLYVSDLMGSTVVEGEEVLGSVAGWEETGGVPLLRVEGSQGEMLIPYTPEICLAVDAAHRRIEVRTPEGLRDLNPSSRTGHPKR